MVAKLQERATGPSKPATITPLTKDAHVADLENRIREKLGTKVQFALFAGKRKFGDLFFQ